MAIAVLTLAGLALTSLGATGAAAQSAGDEQYADPLAGGGQQPPQAPPASGDEPTSDPPSSAPSPAPVTPSAPDASTTAGSVAAAPSGETLPRTGAEPVPIVATGLLLLVGGALLRQRTRSGATS